MASDPDILNNLIETKVVGQIRLDSDEHPVNMADASHRLDDVAQGARQY